MSSQGREWNVLRVIGPLVPCEETSLSLITIVWEGSLDKRLV